MNNFATQYIVMYSKMTSKGPQLFPLEQQFQDREKAIQAAQPYAQWQVLEISAKIVATEKDAK